ncbi:MAG: alpha/beta fold hydrolase [Nevskiaceae bacterium]|nr:MAG: alpha/beta fold hydrolase [Nevskiaceae bacterium]
MCGLHSYIVGRFRGIRRSTASYSFVFAGPLDAPSPPMTTLYSIGADLAFFALSGFATLVVLQRRLIYAAPTGVKHLDLGLFSDRYHRREHRLTLPDGNVLEGFSAHPKIVTPGAPVRVLIYFGGRSENVAWVPDIASNVPGWHVYAFNHRGFGASTGTPSEARLKHDAVCVHAHVLAAHDNAVDTLAIAGRSLGSAVATWLAAKFRVDRLVLLSPFPNLERVIALIPVLGRFKGLLMDSLDSGRHALGVRAPTLVIASRSDDRVPAELSQEFAALVSGPAEVLLVDGLTHAALPRSAPIQSALAAFLRRSV